jgi:hypothetical protein
MSDLPPDDDEAGGIPVGDDGLPVLRGSRMIERQSYERVIDGLRIAAEGFMHLACWEDTEDGKANRKAVARMLDSTRRICIARAGLDDVVRADPTAEVAGTAVFPFRRARDRVVYGLQQAAGGARQLATYHRMDLSWSRVAEEIETLERQVKTGKRMRQCNPLLLPTGYVRPN